jgi:hypothetical protein
MTLIVTIVTPVRSLTFSYSLSLITGVQMPTAASLTVAATLLGDAGDSLLTAGLPFAIRRFQAAKELLDDQVLV